MPVELSVVLASGDIQSCRINGNAVDDEALTLQRLANARDHFDVARETDFTFSGTETGITFNRTDEAGANIQVIDTAWGSQTGFQLIDRAMGVSIAFNGLLTSSGADKDIGVFVKQYPHDGTDINDPAQWVDEVGYFSTTGATNGTILLTDSFPYEEAGTAFAVTAIVGSGGGATNFTYLSNAFGRAVDACTLKITSVVPPTA